MTTTNHRGAALGILTVLCWSGYNVAAKHGVDTGFSPQALALLRFAVPGVIALPVLAVLYLRKNNIGIPVTRLAVLILLGGPIFGLTAASGYVHAPLSHGLLFAPVAVFVTVALLGRLLLKEHLSTNRLIGAGVMLLGLAILVGFNVGSIEETWAQGVVLFMLAGAMWGAYTVLLRLWQVPMIKGLLAVAAGSALISVPVLGPGASETLLTASPSGLALQIVMQGLVAGVASVVALIGAVRTLSAQVVALLPVFTPVVALAMAAALLGQVPSLAELIGVTIIVSGFLLSFRGSVMTGFSKSSSAVLHS
ncbi:DMT family transporter [Aestuariivita sp.]|jgi:drug/metabolite transporter (DMT)-like permease|uniref:DMT family transporter n=1 Tax=Aestuariivita sp. TaxID=1872407 RepID=UPI00216F3256|nr:DMT family transporter [Aestuariivita sp.]MCE8007469.1 DMT family transporter [Aestuariivita sp.]